MKNKDVKINFSYQSIEYNKDTNLYLVARNGAYGVIAIDGNVVIDIAYRSIKFNGIYILAKSYTEDVYFNQKGERVTDYIAKYKAKDTNYYVVVNNQNQYGIADENGKETVKPQYLYIEYLFDKYFAAYKEGVGLGAIDVSGDVYIDFGYDVLSKIGEFNLVKGIDMENNVTDIFSISMNKVASMQNAILDIHRDYIEVSNEEQKIQVTGSGDIKENNI